MIAGCLEEMQDERRAAPLASNSANQQKSIASNQMDKIKWWKGKYEELQLFKDSYINQTTQIEGMQQKIDEYDVLTEEMTEDYGQQSYLCVHSISKRQE
jgi:hypothetical protein